MYMLCPSTAEFIYISFYRNKLALAFVYGNVSNISLKIAPHRPNTKFGQEVIRQLN